MRECCLATCMLNVYGADQHLWPNWMTNQPLSPSAHTVSFLADDRKRASQSINICSGCTRAYHCCLQDDFKNELAAQKVFLQGPDKHGRGVIILKVSRHSKTKRDLEETKRLICHTLDHQIKLHDLRLNPDAKGVGIFDLRGTGDLLGPRQKLFCCALVSLMICVCMTASASCGTTAVIW